MNGRLPAANEGQGGALHERTSVGSAAAGALRDNQLRCAARWRERTFVAARSIAIGQGVRWTSSSSWSHGLIAA